MRALSVGANLTATVTTTLYTVPTGYCAKVVLLRVTNATASNKHITFDWVDSSAATTYSVVFQQTITTKTTQDWGSTVYFVMEEGDSLRATSETGATMAVVVTLEEEGRTRS